MRAVVQRVSRASVIVTGDVVGDIGRGIVVLIGVERGDDRGDVDAIVDKIASMRLFPGGGSAQQKKSDFERSVGEIDGEVLVVSQFTLLADIRRGRRPSFTAAAPPEQSAPLVELAIERFESHGLTTASGVFGAAMRVELVNDGPVTIVVETAVGKVR